MNEGDGFVGGSLALDFVNTMGGHRDREHQDKLASYADLIEWAVEGKAIQRVHASSLAAFARAHPMSAAKTLRRAKVFREALHAVFETIIEERPSSKSDLDRINEEFGRSFAHARLRGTGKRFAWDWEPLADALDAPLWPVARAAAELLTSSGHDRLRECASLTCGWFFLDLSKNRSRRWCDMRNCGNRDKVRRYRAHQSESR